MAEPMRDSRMGILSHQAQKQEVAALKAEADRLLAAAIKQLRECDAVVVRLSASAQRPCRMTEGRTGALGAPDDSSGERCSATSPPD